MPPSSVLFGLMNEKRPKNVREFLVTLKYRKKKGHLWGGVYIRMIFEQMVCLNCLQFTTKKDLGTRF